MKLQGIDIRIRAARLHLGWSMDRLSNETGKVVTKQSISKYELGAMQPKIGTIKSLAKAMGVSCEYFYGSNVSIDVPMLRRIPKGRMSKDELDFIEAKLAFWVERYRIVEKHIGDLHQFHNPISDIEVRNIEDAIQAADRLREAWHCGDGPIASILRLMERKGIKIMSDELPNGILGLSTWADGHEPLVVIDMRQEMHTIEQIRFTASHELGHLMLNIPDDIEDAKREKLCHVFGCFLLLPASTLYEEIGAREREYLTLDELIDLHEIYGLSIAALVHQAWDLKIISRNEYDRWYDEKIKKNPTEKGWGVYLYPETIGREKRLRSIVEQKGQNNYYNI